MHVSLNDSEIASEYRVKGLNGMQIMDKHSDIKLPDKRVMSLAITIQQYLKDLLEHLFSGIK